ncbi:uncharacterized protein LOC134722421 [Mytilus trossulus]|uniref:uncharacterized protein LOC134722421 n=1 Tax=Mytilus trossulus TaxID=6551 RepID=UPI0030049D85
MTRDAEYYIRFFNLLKNIANQLYLNFHPNKVSLDFECASRNAVSHVFPNAELKGSLFHYAKAIWKKTQEYGLQTQYKDVPDVNKLVRRAAALTLLPLDRVEDYWLHALENAPQSDACTKLTDYIVLTWLEGRYPQPTWNHHQTEGPRTNNHLEGWHNKLKKRVKTAHPNIFEIINVLKKEQAANEVKKVQYAAGGKMRGKAKKYRELEERFATLKESLHNGTKDYIQYGDAASYLEIR